MPGIQEYRRELEKARERLAQVLKSGTARAVRLAIIRRTIALMAYQLDNLTSTVTAYDHLEENGLSGAALWHRHTQSLAARKFQPDAAHPGRFRRKYQQYLTFAQRTIVSTSAQREYIRDRTHGVMYIVRHNEQVVDLVQTIMSGLMEWARRHKTDDDFFDLSPEEGLQQMLLEQTQYVAALRVAQQLPPDVTRVAISIERPDHVFVVETAISLIPVVGSVVALYEAYTGRDLFGYELDTIDRTILAGSVLLPAAGRLVKGGKALYTTSRMQRMYGRDAGQWSRALATSERLSADAAGYRAMRQAEGEVRAGRGLSRRLQRQVDNAVQGGFARARSVRSSVPQTVTEAFERLSRQHEILEGLDELALARILERAPNEAHMKGQLLEELLENRVAEDFLQSNVGVSAMGLSEAVENLEFIPGHLIRDAFGRQITDGVVARRLGDRLVLEAIFEAKAGQRAARELSLSSGGRSALSEADRLELRAYARDIYRELQERARLEGTGVNANIEDIERMVVMSERGGQIRRDIERLAADADGNLTNLFIGGVETPVQVSPTRTRMIGVVPKDLRTRNIQDTLEGLDYNFEVWGIDITASDIQSIARELLDLS